MSQISSQVQVPNWTSIPFAKFSHNTSKFGTRNFVWNHVGARNDLDFIVRDMRIADDQGSYTNRILLKITAGPEILETQDLGELIKYTCRFDPSSSAEQPVQVVTRSPFLAMRYPKASNEIRRIQMKFHNPDDFSKAAQILRSLGLPIMETPHKTISTVRPSTSPATSILSSISTSSSTTLGRSLPRPSSMQDSSRPLGLQFPSPPRSDFKAPIHPVTYNQILHRPSSAQPYNMMPVQNLAPIPISAAASSASMMTSSNDGVRQSPSLYKSQIERDYSSRRFSHPTFQALDPPCDGQYSNLSLFVSQLQAQRQSASESGQVEDRLSTNAPTFLPGTATHCRAESSTEIDHALCHGDLVTNFHNGEASNARLVGHYSVHDIIPPRRDLPFPKPRKPSKTIGSTTSELPSAPKSAPMKKDNSAVMSKKPANEATLPSVPSLVKKRVAHRKELVTDVVPPVLETKETPAKVNNIMASPIHVTQVNQLSPLAAKSAAAIRPASTTPGLQSKAAATKKRPAIPASSNPSSVAKRRKMVDHGTQTQMFSAHSHTTAVQSAPGSERAGNTAGEVSVLSPPDDYLSNLEVFVSKYKDRPAPKEFWEAPGYAEADIETRHILLNNFICENLENADFLQLCQDTETVWRKIGLGI